jgi:predicted transcriptional regulator
MPADVHQIHLRLPAELHKAAQRAAEENDRSFSYVTRQALEEFLKARGYLRTDA